MKHSKSIITQHLVLNLLLQVIIIVAICLPELAPYRALAETTVRLPSGTIWMPLLGILVIANIFSLSRLRKKISVPLQQLVNQTKLGSSTYAFKTKSVIGEVDYMKHFIESRALKFDEIEQEVQRMQNEVEKAESISRIQPAEYERLSKELESAKAETATLKNSLEDQARDRKRLENNLNLTEKALRQSKRDYDELRYEQSSGASNDQADLSSLLERVTGSLSIINNLSRRLAESWADSTPGEMRDAFKEINNESQTQLDELQDKLN